MENPNYRSAAARRQLEEDLADAYEQKWQELLETDEFNPRPGKNQIEALGDIEGIEAMQFEDLLTEAAEHTDDSEFAVAVVAWLQEKTVERFTEYAKLKAKELIYGKD